MEDVDRRLALSLPVVLGTCAVATQAFGQSTSDLEKEFSETRQLFDAYRLSSPDELPIFFAALWETRLAFSFAEIEDGVDQELEDILTRAVTALTERVEELEGELGFLVKRNTARLQNNIISLGTDVKTGATMIQRRVVLSATQSICPLYPFC